MVISSISRHIMMIIQNTSMNHFYRESTANSTLLSKRSEPFSI